MPVLEVMCVTSGLPWWLSSKESAYNTGAAGGVGGHGSPLQYSCLEDPMDRGAWWAAVRGITKNWLSLK